MASSRGRAFAAGEIGDRVTLATWPNYHDPANFDNFTAETGVAVQVNVFGSNEEMLAKLQAGGTGWDVFVPTNYTISHLQKLGIIEPLDLAHAAELRRRAPTIARFTERGHDRRHGLCGAEGLGHHRLRRQHQEGHRSR